MCSITVSQTLSCVTFHLIPGPVLHSIWFLCSLDPPVFCFPSHRPTRCHGGEWLSANNRALSAVNTHTDTAPSWTINILMPKFYRSHWTWKGTDGGKKKTRSRLKAMLFWISAESQTECRATSAAKKTRFRLHNRTSHCKLQSKRSRKCRL